MGGFSFINNPPGDGGVRGGSCFFFTLRPRYFLAGKSKGHWYGVERKTAGRLLQDAGLEKPRA